MVEITKSRIFKLVEKGDKYSVYDNKKALIYYHRAMRYMIKLGDDTLKASDVFSEKSIESLKLIYKYGAGILSVESYKQDAKEVLEFINPDLIIEADGELANDKAKRDDYYNEWIERRRQHQNALKEKFDEEYGNDYEIIMENAKKDIGNLIVDGLVFTKIVRDKLW